MSRIIYCSDLVLRIEDPSEEINNITEWIQESTDFQPQYPNECVLREEVGSLGKLSVIFMVWMSLVALTIFYCYFCEQRLFPRQKLLDWSNLNTCRRSCRSVSRTSSFLSNLSMRTRRETLYSPSFSSQGSWNPGCQPQANLGRSGDLGFGEFRLLPDSLGPGQRYRGAYNNQFSDDVFQERHGSRERLTDAFT